MSSALQPAADFADLASVYDELCSRHGARPSAELRALLKGRTEMRMIDLDLRKAYIGKKQVPVIAELVAICSNLTELNVSHAQLDNDGAAALARALNEHPSVTAVDMSHNDLSLPSGKLLLDLARNNPNIQSVRVGGTDISDVYRERIDLQTELNAARGGPVKDLSNDTGELDGGVGAGAQRVRRGLGMEPPCGADDEEWEWDSNLDDAELWRAADAKQRAEIAAEEELLGGEGGGVDDEEDDGGDLIPAFNAAEVATQDAGVGAADTLLNPCPLRRQTVSAVADELFDSGGEKWTDPTFPPAASSLVTAGGRAQRARRLRGVGWARASELAQAPRPELFIDPKRPSPAVQGALHDSWLATACSLLACRHPELVTRLFTASHPDIGAYEVRVCKSGRWFDVVIDDWLPVDDTDHLLYMRCHDPNELWAALLEKAMAKLHGGYDRLERGSSTMALADLTGGVCHAIRIRDHKRAKEVVADSSYWDTLRGYAADRWLLSAAAKVDNDVERVSLRQCGVAPNRLYEIVDFVEIPKWRVVRLCEPWPADGDGDTSSQAWLGREWLQQLPEDDYKQLLWRFGRAENPNGTMRWMTFESFAILFNKVYITRLFAEPSARFQYISERVVGQWSGTSAGGRLREQYFTENPCWCLRVKERNTPVLVQMSQPDARLNRRNESLAYPHKIGLYVVKAPDPSHKKRHWRKEEMVVTPRFVAYRDTCTELLCQPLTNYFLIPCTEQPGVEKPFSLHCIAPHPYTLREVPSAQDEEIKCAGQWRGPTAGGRPTGSPLWVNNPQYRLYIREGANVALILHQIPKRDPVYIAVFLFKGSNGMRVEQYRADDVALSTDFGPYRTTFCETELPAGDYTIVPMTWAKGEEAGFELSCITRARATLTPLKSLTTSEP